MKKIFVALLSFITMGITAQKQSNDNPFGLVYQGAIAKNEKGKVNITPVTYKHSGLTIAANVIRLPILTLKRSILP